MNLLVFLPFGILIVPFIPTFLEMFRRKDKGPKDIPEQSTYEEKPELEVSRLERARGEARAKMPGEIIRVTGNASIPDGTEIDNHLVVQGNLRLGKRCHVRGSVKTFGDIEIGEASTIEGHVLSEGKIIVGRNCIVRGIVDSLKDIILEQNAVVEAISTEKTVKLGPGAKINKRVLSGVSINTSFDQPQIQQSELIEKAEPAPQPPTKMKRPSVAIDRVQPVEKEPKFRELKPQSSAVTPEARRSEPARLKEIERAEEPEKETVRITDRIFGYLEDRIRKLDKVRRGPMEGLSLEGLSPIEIEVLKLTYVCSSIEEICLRLLKDPIQVQEILNSLIEKGYLDNDLNPKGQRAKEAPGTPIPERIRTAEDLQPAPTEAETKEEPAAFEEGLKKGRLSDRELIERLIASKMRAELKKKIRIKKEKSSEDERETPFDEGENASASEQEETKDTSKEHEKANEESGEEFQSGRTSRKGEGENVRDEFRKVEKDSFASESSLKPSASRFKSFSEVAKSENVIPGSPVSKGIFFLPVMTLITLLSAEITYYSPRLVAFLDNVVPFNLKVWLLLLVLAGGLGSASGFHILRTLNRHEGLGNIVEGGFDNG